jgi:hypothetical protein
MFEKLNLHQSTFKIIEFPKFAANIKKHSHSTFEEIFIQNYSVFHTFQHNTNIKYKQLLETITGSL